MAYTGIFCTEAEMQFKAGENRDVTGDTEANHNQIAAEVESFINSTCRYNFSDSYSSMSADVRAILKEAASNLCAVYLIQYNMAGYSSRIEAEDMVNILLSRFNACIEILKDQKLVTYLNGTATGTQASDTTDEVTITKNASGVISVKGATGAANAANGVTVLTGAGYYPALNGSLITNMDIGLKIIQTITLGSAAASIDFTGLTAESYMLVFNVKPTAGFGMYLTVNGDATAANYYTQYMNASGASTAFARANTPRICDVNAGSSATGTIYITKNANGYFTTNYITNQGTSGSDIQIYNGASQKTATVASITQLTFTTTTSTFAAGSTVTLYSMGV